MKTRTVTVTVAGYNSDSSPEYKIAFHEGVVTKIIWFTADYHKIGSVVTNWLVNAILGTSSSIHD